MIVDFHTHIFPDSIAEKTISKLSGLIGQKPYTDATLKGLQQSMKDAKVDYAVVLPVVTRPAQFETVNRYAVEISKNPGILSFGGVHPKSESYRDEIDKIVQLGLKGIKLHPDFQDTFIEEPCYIDLIAYALERDLIVTIHTGKDEGLQEPVHCPPDKTLHMIQEVQKRVSTRNLILAHTGGHTMWDEVEEYLVGQDVYMDISFSRSEIAPEQMARIIQDHGADRILFGSDSPWDGQSETIQFVKSLDITDEEKELILGLNGARLLGLSNRI